ncbi:putative membrane protein [Gottschalkia purinilytica]|uniref:Putative membrane protein n=2 Tax=Gottschalkia purinilytica TaxID=1503 RepID=A0A0L0WF09_GOTPU|nr:putative membrane protein [Gottschalkia purinilytica]
MLFISSIVFGKKKGAISGAIGMTIFDVLSGWVAWAPFTFVVRWIMGYIVGYYVTEGILYGNWISPVTSIPGNAIQIAAGGIVSLPLAYSLKRTKAF